MYKLLLVLLLSSLVLATNIRRPCQEKFRERCLDRAISDVCRTDGEHNHAVWLNNISSNKSLEHFIFDQDLTDKLNFIREYENGVAFISGVLRAIQDENKGFIFSGFLHGRVSPGDPGYSDITPKKELNGSCYGCHPKIDTNKWYYYENMQMIMEGVDDFEGLVIRVTRNKFFGPQIGKGANSMNRNYGMSFWLDYEVLEDPHDLITATTDLYGDFNLDFNRCKTCVRRKPEKSPRKWNKETTTTHTVTTTEEE